MKKTYKDLSPEEDVAFELWWGFFEDSIRNARTQIKRWKLSEDNWDLEMFFVALAFVDDAANGLSSFLTYDTEVWPLLKRFRDRFGEESDNALKLRALRNDIVHRKKLTQLQDRKGNPLSTLPFVIVGAYHADKDEYYFGNHKIVVTEAFDLVQTLTHELKTLLADRIGEYYSTGRVTGMIPFTHLRSFERDL